MNQFARIIILCFICYLLPSCQSFKIPEFVSYDHLNIEKFGFKTTMISANLNYFNSNSTGVILNKTDIDIYINNSLLGHSSQNFQLKVKSKSNFTIPIKVEIDMKNLLKNTFSSLLNKQVTMRIVGKIKVRKGYFYKTFPIDYSTKQELSLF